MGPILTARSSQIAAGYASVAGNVDVKAIHEQQGVIIPAGSPANVEKCPHASAALAAACMVQDLANARKQTAKPKAVSTDAAATAKPAVSGCPFHAAAAAAATPPTAKVVTEEVKPQVATAAVEEQFGYDKFYQAELEKKRGDKSYRYFNNINRMASKFPIAHTGNAKDQVEVWCANDYLGMGNNPVVLETMQYVYFFYSQHEV
jgi:5-aminolevulinate synthase